HLLGFSSNRRVNVRIFELQFLIYSFYARESGYLLLCLSKSSGEIPAYAGIKNPLDLLKRV
ncbi:MAG: hypothetical protein KAJ28_06320, partial [Flavobacteriaceae bacterium]|nr:hypothetical protein [Flavobacteriaceae bacterium]